MSLRSRAAIAFAGASIVALTALEVALIVRIWTPDAIEHAGIAQALCNGRGFVDPVHFNYFIDARVPVPAFAVRPPLVPLLIAVPMCLGATLTTVAALHAIWAGAIAGAAILVAARWMSLPAAAAAMLIFAASPSWQLVAATPLTEITGFGAILLMLIALPGVARSPRAALACAVATVAVWLARPNLAVAAVAVIGTVFWQMGLRAAWSRPLWTYLGALLLTVGVIHVIVEQLTGFAPYASAEVVGQIFDTASASRYGEPYPGRLAFVTDNWSAIAEIISRNLRTLWRLLFVNRHYLHIGWVAVPAIIYTLSRRDRAAEAIFCALLAIVLSAMSVLNYSFFEPRYLLFPAILGTLVVAPLADDAALALGRRLASLSTRYAKVLRQIPRLALYAFVVFLVLDNSPLLNRIAKRPAAVIAAARKAGPPPRRTLCRVPKDAVVASDMPWRVFRWCGNAALKIPLNIGTTGVLDRFLNDQGVDYVLLRASRVAANRTLQQSKKLVLLTSFDEDRDAGFVKKKTAKRETWSLFQVVAADGIRGWDSPGPLERAGFDTD